MLLLPLVAALGFPAAASPTAASPTAASPTTRATADAPTLLWVELPDSTARARARALGLGFAEGREGAWVLMDGPRDSEARLDRAGLRWRPAVEPQPVADEGYHDPEEMVAALQALAEQAPDLVQLVELGHSVEGRPLVGLRLGVAEDPRVGWRLVGTHHGNEGSGAELSLEIARQLVQAWSTDSDPELAELLARDEVWVIPHLNPDGVAHNSRYNANTVDLNRNYAYQWSSSEYLSGDAPFSEPETRALRALHAWTPFAGGLSFHSGAANIGWVWNYMTSPAPDAALVEQLAQQYGDACTVPGFWLTNGADWYITYGDTTDWAYGHHGVLDFTVEASVDKSPPAEQLPDLLAQHWSGVRAFLLAPDSVAGQVVDAATGQGIPAVVTPLDSGWPQLTGPQGRFARLTVDDSTVSMQVSAPGYQAREIDLQPGDEAIQVDLERTHQLWLRPQPAVLAQGSELRFRVDGTGDDDRMWLSRPGAESIEATRSGDEWALPSGALEAGPWDIELDGVVAPRALLVADEDDQTTVEDVDIDGHGHALVTGQGFGSGSRVWALAGELRAPQPVPLLSEDDGHLELDLSAWLGEDAPVDLVLLSSGHQMAVGDIMGLMDLLDDTGAPQQLDTATPDSGLTDDDSSPVQALGCGCSSSPAAPLPSAPFPSAFLLLTPLIAWRRRSQP